VHFAHVSLSRLLSNVFLQNDTCVAVVLFRVWQDKRSKPGQGSVVYVASDDPKSVGHLRNAAKSLQASSLSFAHLQLPVFHVGKIVRGVSQLCTYHGCGAWKRVRAPLQPSSLGYATCPLTP